MSGPMISPPVNNPISTYTLNSALRVGTSRVVSTLPHRHDLPPPCRQINRTMEPGTPSVTKRPEVGNSYCREALCDPKFPVFLSIHRAGTLTVRNPSVTGNSCHKVSRDGELTVYLKVERSCKSLCREDLSNRKLQVSVKIQRSGS
ncbi:hypothetical protein J6590_088061 [Homalodisca vitripennis]|nr:hypothetical protein J6590_088061 [Homalodisca vitripennis]